MEIEPRELLDITRPKNRAATIQDHKDFAALGLEGIEIMLDEILSRISTEGTSYLETMESSVTDVNELVM